MAARHLLIHYEYFYIFDSLTFTLTVSLTLNLSFTVLLLFLSGLSVGSMTLNVDLTNFDLNFEIELDLVP